MQGHDNELFTSSFQETLRAYLDADNWEDKALFWEVLKTSVSQKDQRDEAEKLLLVYTHGAAWLYANHQEREWGKLSPGEVLELVTMATTEEDLRELDSSHLEVILTAIEHLQEILEVEYN